ncbi:MAG: hypothetical protein D6E12_15040 [Desulfovibrio sp.]|nr:MAG: hypothetical protein D6E12_15040 [Desulfovibrio sp.]
MVRQEVAEHAFKDKRGEDKPGDFLYVASRPIHWPAGFHKKPSTQENPMRITILLTCLLALALAFAANATGETTVTDGTEMVTAECGKCHGLDRTCAILGNKTPEEWTALITRMGEKKGGFSAEQIALISGYLAEAEPGDPAICE